MHTGVDLGYNTTAVITLNSKGKVLYKKTFGYGNNDELKGAAKGHPLLRNKLYEYEFREFFLENDITGTVVMEYPMGSFFGNAIKLAEMFGFYGSVLLDYFPAEKVFVPKASSIKKFITGHGNASKEDVIQACEALGYTVNSEHEADALAMALMSYKNSL
ncbi:hypothetical protein M0R04_05975 [Candidatus Dojkabacteria bacterium]|jgi:hypothetical protein|nr:hypothetical protein [Candidatus Dojkabacteria bacterium]